MDDLVKEVGRDVINRAIEESQDLTIQSNAKGENQSGVFLVNYLARAGLLLSPWWSPSRDTQLRDFWKKSDHLSGALYTMTSKISAIPVKIVARNMSDKRAVRLAEETTETINMTPDFGNGWVSSCARWVEDLLSQDNGAFWEIIGAGPKDGPIFGQPVSVAQLDAARCQRTGNAIFPIIYTDTDGGRYKLHFSRVVFSSQMTSPIAEMLGVGFCANSRCVGVAQNLIDIITYKQEKLGSRPHRQVVITQGGLDPADIRSALQYAEAGNDSAGLSRYSKVVVGGSRTIPEANVAVLELSSMPDGFNEQDSVTLGMATIALAYGTDARELFPALSAGATRADALLQHLKQRGKGPGQILQDIERNMNFKFLPASLKWESDFQDDAQDRQTAEIRMLRANSRVQDTTTSAKSERVIREQMLQDGDISYAQFENLELGSGRLEDGTPVLSLFYSKKPEYSRLLSLPGVTDPTNTRINNPELVLAGIEEKRSEIYEILANVKLLPERAVALQCQAALAELEVLYTPSQAQLEEEQPKTSVPSGNGNGNGKPKPFSNKRGEGRSVPGHEYIDPRIRQISPVSQSPNEMGSGGSFGGDSGTE